MSIDPALKIAYLERRVSELEAQYDRLAKDAYHFRRLAQQFEFAIRDHRDLVQRNAHAADADLRLWRVLDL